MIAEAQPWLPTAALARRAVGRAIDAAVDNWSAAWFGGHRLTAAVFRPVSGPNASRAEGGGWQVYGTSMALAIGEAAKTRLVGWALDGPMDMLALEGADAKVVARFGHLLLGDLARAVEAALGTAPDVLPTPRLVDHPFGRAGGVEVPLGEGQGGALLTLAIPGEAVLPLCRASLPPARPARTPLTRPREAIGSTRVRLQATLGHASIGLADLRRLSEGDVLVLDRALDQGASLLAAGLPEPVASAELGAADGRVTLALQTAQD